MAVVYTEPSEYKIFIEKMWHFPFLRIAVFSIISSFVFKRILLLNSFGDLLMLIAMITFVVRVFTPFLGMVEHKFSVICMWCMFIIAECKTVVHFESISSIFAGGVEKIFLEALGFIAWIALAVGALAFLARIFVVFFANHY